MKEGIRTYRFHFHATIGDFALNASNISSPLAATWKRSNQSVSTETVQMVAGKVNFNQTITLPLNMYYEEAKQIFQEKKTMFTFTMSTPKGQKQAGVVYVEVAKMLNQKIQNLCETYTLEKCPIKESKVTITLTYELIEEVAAIDAMSIDSSMLMKNPGVSTLSIESKREIPKQPKQEPKVEQSSSKGQQKQKDTKIQVLQQQIAELKQEKGKLLKELQKSRSKDDNAEISGLKDELTKSKALQVKLENEITTLRNENIDHERELQKMRLRMEQIYELLLGNLNSLY